MTVAVGLNPRSDAADVLRRGIQPVGLIGQRLQGAAEILPAGILQPVQLNGKLEGGGRHG